MRFQIPTAMASRLPDLEVLCLFTSGPWNLARLVRGCNEAKTSFYWYSALSYFVG